MSEHRLALALAGGVARLRMIRAQRRNATDPRWVPELEPPPTPLQQARSHRAGEMMLHNRVVSAADALDWGLIARVVPAADLDAEAEAAAAGMAAGPTLAYGEMRQLLWRSLSVGVDDQLQAELEAIVRCGATADAREGVSAFNERRPPKFTGR